MSIRHSDSTDEVRGGSEISSVSCSNVHHHRPRSFLSVFVHKGSIASMRGPPQRQVDADDDCCVAAAAAADAVAGFVDPSLSIVISWRICISYRCKYYCHVVNET